MTSIVKFFKVLFVSSLAAFLAAIATFASAAVLMSTQTSDTDLNETTRGPLDATFVVVSRDDSDDGDHESDDDDHEDSDSDDDHPEDSDSDDNGSASNNGDVEHEGEDDGENDATEKDDDDDNEREDDERADDDEENTRSTLSKSATSPYTV